MNRPRLLLAASVALAALFATALPAGAGLSATLDDDITCNTATGEYDIEFTITNMTNEEGDIEVLEWDVDGAAAALSFAPDPVPGNGATSVATTSVPGSTTTLFLDVEIVFAQFTSELSFESTLDGDCESIPTTTTTSTTMAPTTTVAPAAAAVAVAARPAFTG